MSQNCDVTGKSLSKLRIQVLEAQEEAKQAAAQQQQQQHLHQQQLLLLQQQQQLLLEQVTEMASQLGEVSAVADSTEGPSEHSRGSHRQALRSPTRAVEEKPAAAHRETSAQFARRLHTAVDEKRYDDAFGMAVSADIQKYTKGYWVTYLCKTLDAGLLFDMDPPPMGQPALLGIVKGAQRSFFLFFCTSPVRLSFCSAASLTSGGSVC